MTKNWSILSTSFNSLSDILFISFITFIFITLVCLLHRSKKFKNFGISRSSRHYWTFHDLIIKPIYCNLCSSSIVSGFHCDSCDIYVDIKCIKKANKHTNCKISISNESSLKHQWIKGNLPLDSICFLCTKSCGVLPALSDYKCVLCWKFIHENCLNNQLKEDFCDFGQFKNIILQPCILQCSNQKSQITQLFNTQLKRDDLKNECRPLVVFANTKSGGNDAEYIMRHLRTILNPLQIIDLNQVDCNKTLKWISDYSEFLNFRILICGGDGTICYLLEAISKLNFKNELQFAILPLGTGNDLSRSLGWGSGCSGDVDVNEILEQIEQASTTRLDRWKINIKKLKKNKLALKAIENHIKYMNNYFSIGCDALVTLNFHLKRQSLPISNRLINKFIYFQYGTVDTFMKECRFLSENICVELDGRQIELPHLESIVVLNIPYWGAGVKVWGEREDIPTQRIDDGYLEVLGIYSSFHIAQLQVNLSEPYRIGQAKRVKIITKKKYPMQIDGEPWNEEPSEIEITYHNSVLFLKNISTY